MKSDDFVELYERLRGARSANQVLDAEASFMQKDYSAALKTLQFARDSYHKGHARLLRDEAADNPALQVKREKVQQILGRFDALIAMLTVASEKHPTPLKHPDLPAGFLAKYAAVTTPDDRLDLIYRAFSVSAVKALRDLQGGALYFIANENQTFLVLLDDPLPSDDSVPMRALDSGKRLKALSREAFRELGKRGWLIRLHAKQTAPPTLAGQSARASETASSETASQAASDAGVDVHERDKVLDIGAFTQLLDSAQRSGMLPEADQIAHVRDREFRLGHFQKALLTMEGLQGKFSANAAVKQAEIRREDLAISSGRVKMSPKDLQAKRMRDQALNQAVERARGRFARVMDGLRILARTLDVDDK